METMPRKTDKRIRLIEAAKTLIHRQGFHLTTLADIAQEADVPLGNVYYYFKTKEAIGMAVIEKRTVEWAQRLAGWTEIADPLARLMALVNYSLENIEEAARFGCPLGGLCQELGKTGGPLADCAAKLLYDILQWTKEQLRALGIEESRAFALASGLLSNIQGMFLVAHTLKEVHLAYKQGEEIKQWLEKLADRQYTLDPLPILKRDKAMEMEAVD